MNKSSAAMIFDVPFNLHSTMSLTLLCSQYNDSILVLKALEGRTLFYWCALHMHILHYIYFMSRLVVHSC